MGLFQTERHGEVCLLFRVGTEHFEYRAFCLQLGQTTAQRFLAFVPLNIDVEEIFPGGVTRGAGIEAMNVDVMVAEVLKHLHQGTGAVRHGETDGGAIQPAGACALGADDHEARGVGSDVLHLFGQYFKSVQAGCKRAAESGSTIRRFFYGQSGGCSAAGSRYLIRVRIILLQLLAALPQHLGMRVDGAYVFGRYVSHEAILNALVYLGTDAQVGVGKEIHGLHHVAVGAVFQRNHAVVDLVALHGCKNVGERGKGNQLHAITEAAECSLVAPGPFRTQVTNAHVAFQVERAAHNLPPDTQHAFFR